MRTLTFRLTLWYAGLFTGLSITVLVLVSFALSSNLMRRRDVDLRDDALNFAQILRRGGVATLQSEFDEEAASNNSEKVFLILLSPRSELIAASDLSAWKHLDHGAIASETAPAGSETMRSLSIMGHKHHIRVLSKRMADGTIMELGDSLDSDEQLMAEIRRIFWVVSATMLLLGSFLGYWMARHAMLGVKKITKTAERIAKGKLDRRVIVKGEGEEIDRLAVAFNNMLERIEYLVTELREVTNNIAHDLRSPITSIRGIAETTLMGRQGLDEYKTMAATIVGESDRLVGMINTMLEIAAADSGAWVVPPDPVDVSEILQNAYDLFQPVAEDRGVSLEIDSPSGPLFTMGALDRLQRVVANLLDNALKYTPTGGKAVLSTRQTLGHIQVIVTDTGIGIREEDLSRIFARFYRADRSRSTPGNGLGLSLADSIIRAHGGEIKVESIPGAGSTFTILLPSLSNNPGGRPELLQHNPS